MKLPADLALRWARQWENPDLREARLLDGGAWPCRLAIGRPDPAKVSARWSEVADQLKAWRGVRVGTVHWEAVSYRATGKAVEIPVGWEIANAEEWITAAADRGVRGEFDALSQILVAADPAFHSALVRERSLWRNRPVGQTILAVRLALLLEPGAADGQPLRSLSLAGIDSKFFERHRGLILRLLDLRHDGEPTRQGLETFLDAARGNGHWLLLARLGETDATEMSWLPFPLMRVRAADLASAELSASRVLVIENERCLHLLPCDLPDTVAIFGAGNDLAWLGAPWIQRARVAYWGDLDTWGLTLLARARELLPTLSPLLMTREVFDRHLASAVRETVPAGATPPTALTPVESDLYRHLLTRTEGRLEQEFIAPEIVATAVREWAGD